MNVVVPAEPILTDEASCPSVPNEMSAADLAAAMRELSASIGPKAEASMVILQNRFDGNHAGLAIYQEGMSSSRLGAKCFNAPDWPTVFARAGVWAEVARQDRDSTIVRRMALAILDLSDEGECTQAALLKAGFTEGEIAEFHSTACKRAGEIAGHQPFAVIFT